MKAKSLVFSSLCFLGLSGCLQPAKPFLDKGLSLSDAGFIAHSANTTARYTLMNSLPPGMLTYRMAPDGQKIYLYADPIGCGCVYMGNQAAYAALRKKNGDEILQNKRSPLQDGQRLLMDAENRRDTSSWDWTIWSPAADPDNNQPRHMIGDSW